MPPTQLDMDALQAGVDDLTAVVARLSAELEDLAAAAVTGEDADRRQPVQMPLYDTLDAWVRDYFAPMFSRPIGGEIRWCAAWREHAEAVGRLEGLWRSWEALRLDPALGMATWYTSYVDQQLPVLLGRTGPFSQCATDRHTLGPPLPLSTRA